MPAKPKAPPASKSPDALDTPVRLVHGDDDFAVKQRARTLFQEWAESTQSEDREIIDAQAANAGEALQSIARLREALQTLPFFGGTKIIWWQHCNFLGDERTAGAQAVTESLGELAQELKAFPWDNVRLLISAGKADKRKTFYKTLDKIGIAEAFVAWSADDRDWQAAAEHLARQDFRRNQRAIDDEALAELVSSVGPNKEQLSREIEKLCLYADDQRPIALQHVQAVVTRNKQARAFALGDALGDRNLPLLLKTLDEELWEMRLNRQKSEIGILYGLISKVRMMLFLKELQRERLLRPTPSFHEFKSQLERIPPDALPEDRKFNPLAMNPYPLFRAMDHARHYASKELIRAMEILLECNRMLISSSLDGALLLQQALIQIVRKSPTLASSRN